MAGAANDALRSSASPVVIAAWMMVDGGQDTTSLGIHVPDVFALSAQEEVVWPDARWRVASVEHLKTVRNLTVRNFPADSMRQSHPALDLDVAVASDIASADPRPTPISDPDL